MVRFVELTTLTFGLLASLFYPVDLQCQCGYIPYQSCPCQERQPEAPIAPYNPPPQIPPQLHPVHPNSIYFNTNCGTSCDQKPETAPTFAVIPGQNPHPQHVYVPQAVLNGLGFPGPHQTNEVFLEEVVNENPACTSNHCDFVVIRKPKPTRKLKPLTCYKCPVPTCSRKKCIGIVKKPSHNCGAICDPKPRELWSFLVSDDDDDDDDDEDEDEKRISTLDIIIEYCEVSYERYAEIEKCTESLNEIVGKCSTYRSTYGKKACYKSELKEMILLYNP